MKHYVLNLCWLCCLWLLGGTYAQAQAGADYTTVIERSIVPTASYPTYNEYVGILYTMARRYPDKCQLEEWGTLLSGRKIYALRITNQINEGGGKPQVLCTAAMHGDELAGYWVMLRLAESLIKEDRYKLLDDIEIYINPLANPDGVYSSSDNSLSRPRRGNANGVDLNRNYPDPDDGPHPDDHDYQPETRIFMRAARSHSFDLALNVHGGAEVFNYPWDTYRNRHPDNTWWRKVSREFAQRAQVASGRAGYFDDRQNGVTNGHDWYPIAGSRQDYMNFYHRCREATLELSEVKRFPAEDLEELWTYVASPIQGFIAEARNGLHGTVTDYHTGEPLRAQIYIPGHDYQNSDVYTNPRYGDYYRYLAAGTYEIEVSADGYLPQLHTVTIYDNRRLDVDVRLRRVSPSTFEVKRKR